MYQTQYGLFDGDSWERLCQVCFRLKYEQEGYQPIEASPGDFGIEGFTRTGKVFQCYCPESDYSADELYNKQRDKITYDLRKLQTYDKELLKYLGSVKINQWIFVSPASRKKELIEHCVAKAEEYRKKKLSHLAATFDVLFHDIDFFSKELPVALGQVKIKMELPSKSIDEQDASNWSVTQGTLVANAIRKHRARFNPIPADIDERIETLTSGSIKYYLEGYDKLRNWETQYQTRYERFQLITAHYEKRVKEKCLFSVSDHNKMLDEIKKELIDKIQLEFSELGSITVEDLADHIMAKWILECPIDFR